MSPSRPFILRPVATSLLMLAIVLAGLVGWRFLPLSALPQVDYPTIQVQTLYPGASPEVMAQTVTAPLERQFGQMPGLSRMSSTSAAGVSIVTLQFGLGRLPAETMKHLAHHRDLGLHDEVVGITKFCVHPNHLLKNKKIVGGTKQVHFDKIKALQPDIIICNKEENTLEMVQELSAKTQFVYISHNRLAMEMADQLVGVTMQEKGVSSVVSVNLVEAKSMIVSLRSIGLKGGNAEKKSFLFCIDDSIYSL